MGENKRILWIDTAKAIGIFCIYLGHCAGNAGLAYPFVFIFHVPLFFFLSGCTEALSEQKPFSVMLKKNINMLLIPFYLFAGLSIIVKYIVNNSILGLKADLLIVAKGCIRNQFSIRGLWFLSCLFVMRIIFWFIRKYSHTTWQVLTSCILLRVLHECIANITRIDTPSWIFNIDSALYYILFFGLGYVLIKPIEYINEALMQKKNWKKLCWIAFRVIIVAYTAVMFFGKRPIYYAMSGTSIIATQVAETVEVMLAIGCVVCFARVMQSDQKWTVVGRNTLYLCGSEDMARMVVVALLQLVGVKLDMSSPLSAYIYTGFLLLLALQALVPLEKHLLKYWGL